MAKKKEMTPQRLQVLRFIEQYYKEHAFPPSIREICDGIGGDAALSSIVKATMDRLIEQGYLKPGIPGAARTVVPTYKKVTIKTLKEIGEDYAPPKPQAKRQAV